MGYLYTVAVVLIKGIYVLVTFSLIWVEKQRSHNLSFFDLLIMSCTCTSHTWKGCRRTREPVALQ